MGETRQDWLNPPARWRLLDLMLLTMLGAGVMCALLYCPPEPSRFVPDNATRRTAWSWGVALLAFVLARSRIWPFWLPAGVLRLWFAIVVLPVVFGYLAAIYAGLSALRTVASSYLVGVATGIISAAFGQKSEPRAARPGAFATVRRSST